MAHLPPTSSDPELDEATCRELDSEPIDVRDEQPHEIGEHQRQPPRSLRVEQQPHSRSRGRKDRAGTRHLGSKLERGEDVVELEIRVVGEHLVGRHSSSEQIDDHLDWIPHPAKTRTAVTHRGIYGDPVKTAHVSTLLLEHAEQGRDIPWMLRTYRPASCASTS
jgi:hypothetical protein